MREPIENQNILDEVRKVISSSCSQILMSVELMSGYHRDSAKMMTEKMDQIIKDNATALGALGHGILLLNNSMTEFSNQIRMMSENEHTRETDKIHHEQEMEKSAQKHRQELDIVTAQNKWKIITSVSIAILGILTAAGTAVAALIK